MHKGIIRLLKGVFMSVEDVVNVLKDAGFCGDGHTFYKRDVSICVSDTTFMVAYKFSVVGFNIDGLYIEYSSFGMLSIFDKGGACMNLIV